eukprot:g74442.t1
MEFVKITDPDLGLALSVLGQRQQHERLAQAEKMTQEALEKLESKLDEAPVEKIFEQPTCYKPGTTEMTAWLRELRRSYGNTWEGCMAAAKFLEEYQNSKLRTEMFATIPSLSALDDDGISVKGWAGINVKGTSGNTLFASTGRVNTRTKLKRLAVSKKKNFVNF